MQGVHCKVLKMRTTREVYIANTKNRAMNVGCVLPTSSERDVAKTRDENYRCWVYVADTKRLWGCQN